MIHNHPLIAEILVILVMIAGIATPLTSAFYEEGDLNRSLRIATDSCKNVSESLFNSCFDKAVKKFNDDNPERPLELSNSDVYKIRQEMYKKVVKNKIKEANESLKNLKAPKAQTKSILRNNLQASLNGKNSKYSTTVASSLRKRKSILDGNLNVASRLQTRQQQLTASRRQQPTKKPTKTPVRSTPIRPVPTTPDLSINTDTIG